METKIVVRVGMRELINIMEQRLCSRAYWEIRELCNQILDALKIYSDEWKYCIDELKMFIPKCERVGYCSEKYGCGRKIKKSDFQQFIEMAEFYHKQHYDGRKVKDFTLED